MTKTLPICAAFFISELSPIEHFINTINSDQPFNELKPLTQQDFQFTQVELLIPSHPFCTLL